MEEVLDRTWCVKIEAEMEKALLNFENLGESATLGAWDKKKKELTQLKNKMEEIGGGKTNETMEQNPSDLGKLKQ